MPEHKGFIHNDYLGLIGRLLLGGIFIYASIDKIIDPAQFARVIYNYHLLPGSLINSAAIIMPWLEFVCGVVLILGIYRGGASLIINALLMVFLVAIAVNLVRGVDLECGCFSVSSKAKSNAWSLIFRDIGYIIIGLYVYFNKSSRFSLGKPRY